MKHFSRLLFTLLCATGISGYIVAQNDCAAPTVIPAVPYSMTGLTTVGTINDYDDLDACGSASMVNEDYVFSFTPAADMQINIALLNTSIVTSSMSPLAYVGLFVTDLCPDDPMATCVASSDAAMSNPSLSNINLTGGITYFIIVDCSNTLIFGDPANVNFDIEITKNMSVDLAVTSIEGLVSACDLYDEIISCYIANNGLFAASGFNVSYSIDGNPAVVEPFVGSIDPATSGYFEFATLANFPSVGEYQVTVTVSIASDENLLNDELTQSVSKLPIYHTFPMTEDFELGNGYWFSGGTASSWEYGNPDELLAGLVINSAASGDYCWVTNLEGNTNTSETSFLESPCYDLSSLFLPTLNLYAWVNFSLFGNSANIEASIDGGATWSLLYDFAGNTGWEEINFTMPSLAGQSNVKFRINYVGGFLVANGIAIDDFTVKEAVLNDVGVTAIIAPNSGCGLTDSESITIDITNFGAQAQPNVNVDFSIDGGMTWLGAVVPLDYNLTAGETYTFTYGPFDFSAYGDYEIVAKTVNVGDEDLTNDEFYKTIVSQNTIPADGYDESFETGAAGWFAYGENSTMELAMPANTLINSAGDGSYAWVTNATGFNDPAEVSYVESPCFDFTGFVNPKFEALVQYETTQMLANFYLEYSIDGYTWDTVNAGLAPTAWYGGGLLSFGTWSGSSAGWIQVATDIPQIAGQSSVKFRFVFNNGMFSMADTEGVAIDKIVIYDCTNMPNAEFSYSVNGFDVAFNNESTSADSYSWNFGDNEFLPSTSTEENPVFTYMIDGSYYVVLTATNECSSSEYGTYIDIITGNVEVNLFHKSIFPNPASDFINIYGFKAGTMELLNSNGQVVLSNSVDSNVISVDIRNLAAGNYFVKVVIDGKSSVIPFVKE